MMKVEIEAAGNICSITLSVRVALAGCYRLLFKCGPCPQSMVPKLKVLYTRALLQVKQLKHLSTQFTINRNGFASFIGEDMDWTGSSAVHCL